MVEQLKLCKRERKEIEKMNLDMYYKYNILLSLSFNVIKIAFWISVHGPNPYKLVYKLFFDRPAVFALQYFALLDKFI